MLNHPTYDKLTRLKLFGMARAFAEQSALDLEHLGFEERLGLLVEHEVSERDGKALTLRLQRAKLKPNTAAEDTDYRHARGLDKALFQRLLAGLWLKEKQNVLLTGPTGGFCRVDHRKEKFSRNGTTPLKLDGPLPPVHKIGRRTTSHPRRRL